MYFLWYRLYRALRFFVNQGGSRGVKICSLFGINFFAMSMVVSLKKQTWSFGSARVSNAEAQSNCLIDLRKPCAFALA